MDIPDIRTVIHFGVPSSIDQYVQETGRAGRDGAFAQAIILKHRRSLTGNVEEDMKLYVTSEGCRRKCLLAVFNEQASFTSSPLCCDNCCKQSLCCSCSSAVSCNHIEQTCYCVRWCFALNLVCQPTVTPVSSQEAYRQVLSDTTSLESELKQLRCNSAMLPDNVNRIYPELVKNILSNYMYIHDFNDVLQYGALNVSDARQIIDIINRHAPITNLEESFHDMTLNETSDESEQE